jgi:hypothetical protein
MRRFTLPLALGLSLGLLVFGPPPTVRAQAAKSNSERVRFETVDQVELHGTYWPGKGRRGPVALLLHRYGGKSHEDGWDQLAEELQKKGFAVLSFDFRGHGNSTTVGGAFWNQAYNRSMVKGFNPRGKMPTSISVTDFSPRYMPYLTNDISAARLFLERKNDNSECNSSNMVLIGAEEGATLGAMWLASECHRYKVLPGGIGNIGRLNNKPESKDIVACVWLSISPTLGRGVNVYGSLSNWIREAGKEQKIPMAFLYGKDDAAAKRLAPSLIQKIRPGYQGPKNPGQSSPKETVELAVQEGGKLTGSKLLKAGELAHRIADSYLGDSILPTYGNNEWEKRETESSPFVWNYARSIGSPLGILAKPFGDKNLAALPLGYLMR